MSICSPDNEGDKTHYVLPSSKSRGTSPTVHPVIDAHDGESRRKRRLVAFRYRITSDIAESAGRRTVSKPAVSQQPRDELYELSLSVCLSVCLCVYI